MAAATGSRSGGAGQPTLSLDFDPEVSRVHAELERLGDDWTVADDGLSRNGSFVNGERVVGAATAA